jgi:Na+-translocating ferredoxin:NAD+ oxidoreductase RNF subunit RnfB
VNVTSIVTAVSIMGGLALFFGVVLAVADRLLRVEEDPRLEVVKDMLPGSNCGACGEPGCAGFAAVLLDGKKPPSACTVADTQTREDIADVLGVVAGEVTKQVARLFCAGGNSRATQIAAYAGYESCQAAHLVGGGGKGCSWGCLGLADCMRVCDFQAIFMNVDGLPVVDTELCTACGDCVAACPRDLFELLPMTQKLIVQCKTPQAGEEARELCDVACDACGRCAQDAPDGLIRMENNLPVINRESGAPIDAKATLRCPTGAIQWVVDQQFNNAGLVQLRGRTRV